MQPICSVVRIVYANARHLLCIWYMMNKIFKKLSSCIQYEIIKEKLKDIVLVTLREH